ncbi:MAG: NAD(P)(+) transhydrogenase (Re/Si-specific) subunit beta [Alphaproteobacteria bacterium]|nr:NAD(P)(+) transhydrogenase (Re/Si-specific) subunit beta [Alphaproteobacteria bacterium]
MINFFVNTSYLIANTCMILAIKMLATPHTARRGNLVGIMGMFWAIVAALVSLQLDNYWLPIMVILSGAAVGIFMALRVQITALPQMIAILNGLGGLAAVFIAISEVLSRSQNDVSNIMSLILGGVTFSGSIIAFGKLNFPKWSKSVSFAHQNLINLLLSLAVLGFAFGYVLQDHVEAFYALALMAAVMGVLLILPVGGADIPVIIAFLNACSGWAGVCVGLSLQSPVLIVIGTIVGISGTFLAYTMTRVLNRSLLNILIGGMTTHNGEKDADEPKIANVGSPVDAAFLMENAGKIIIVPGFGMAAAHAQHALKNMADVLRNKYQVDVKFAIHPVAGRMPGHMNVLLAEANVDYADVFELEDINGEFQDADVAYVIGANDITNPQAKTNPQSPIYGMPILDVAKAKTVFFVKRSLGAGYSNVENPLFFASNTFMLYGDAAHITEEIVKYLKA